MSRATKTAIYETLTGDATLTALLGEDESDNPSVFNASLNKMLAEQGWSYPAVTFRESSGTADSRLARLTVDEEYWDIEVWAQSESGLTVPAIAERIDELLHNQRLAVDSGEVYDCSRVAQNPDQYDDKLRLSFGLYRYRLVVRR